MGKTTKSRIISALFLAYSSLGLGLTGAASLAQTSAPADRASDTLATQGNVLELAENAPDRHIVAPGDTLWDISAIFLKKPWRWPEIWQLNKEQIKDPHWIYPGQIVYLDRSGDQPRLRIGTPLGASTDANVQRISPTVRKEDNIRAIPSIPQKAIEPFLAQPLIIEAGQLDGAPRIVATQEDRVVVGAGNIAYATGISGKQLLWQIYRPGKALIDPEDNRLLGYEAFYLGNARVIREGEPATLEIFKSTQEIGLNDHLIPAPRPEIVNYVPHAPDKQIKSHVISIYGALEEGATHAIVTLSRGAKDGLEVGHVLALSRAGVIAHNRFKGQQERYQLPEERYGLLFVFRVFEHVSYALVMNVARPVIVGDAATTP